MVVIYKRNSTKNKTLTSNYSMVVNLKTGEKKKENSELLNPAVRGYFTAVHRATEWFLRMKMKCIICSDLHLSKCGPVY